MTREFKYEIGLKLEKVLDVDVLEKGVQWGNFQRVRICIDATKKLIRGKKKAKGKLQVENNLEDDGKMVGGVAVAAGQHRPVQ
nr:hypothetical protein CFP56_53903 [Quercus suber]